MAFKNIADQTNGFIFLAYHSLDQDVPKKLEQRRRTSAQKALIVTDEGLFKFGVADLIASYLTEAGVASHIFRARNLTQPILMSTTV